ncbi:FecR domain-containing protein [Membranicola marinus]|uniref:FecR domain-containing protein n=1 Tax=Membranihabitans marinus TaxID=1227546 RepID=A0A953HXX4_9BACT|nr:FecR domain-containing protein [Membranihabitans marinus]MBY5958681.1 FecR domain-containing protein [Membranihabitans marinus]
MNAEKYIQYRVEDWVQDPLFRNYILDKDTTHGHFWRGLSNESDEIARKMKEASDILQAMSEVHSDYHEEGRRKSAESWKALEQRLPSRKKTSHRRMITLVSAAASIAIAVLVLWVLWPSSQAAVYLTEANETQEVLLPDGSLVYLNENSSLTIHEEWQNGIRDVTLDGEGYFMVRSQADTAGHKKKFTVKTSGLDIEVLGTQFNVQSRDAETRVSLDEGAVKLVHGGAEKTESYMVPGQVASYDQKSNKVAIIEKALVRADELWKPKTIEFDHITLREAIEKMETVFKVEFTSESKAVLGLKINKLSVPSDNPEVFIKTVNILFENKIIIEMDPENGTYAIRELNKSMDQ